jgi:hypothetical protein
MIARLLAVLDSPPEVLAAEPRSSAVMAVARSRTPEARAIYRLRMQTLLLSLPSEGCPRAAEAPALVASVAPPSEARS